MNDVIRFQCQSCERKLRAPARLAGRAAACSCGQSVRVPATVPGGGSRLPLLPLLLGAFAAVFLLLAGAGIGVWALLPARQPEPVAVAEPAPAALKTAPAPDTLRPPTPTVAPDPIGPVTAAAAVGVFTGVASTPHEAVAVPSPPPAPVARPARPAPKKAPAAPDEKAMLDGVKRATALIEGKYGHGSGFLVRPDVVVTNSHVVLCDVMEDVTVRFTTDGVPDDTGVKVKLLYEDKGRDLVFLKLDQPQTRPVLALASGFDPAGRPAAFVIGSPAQLDAGRALANVAEPARCDPEVQLIGGKSFYRLSYSNAAADVRIGHGNSGGPAVNARGEVIGVLTRAAFRADGRPNGQAYCIPVGSIRSALDGLGAPDGWAKHIDLATGRHARDIAAISVYANAVIGAAILNYRFQVNQNGVLDTDVLAKYKKLDAKFRDMARPASKAALASSELSAEQKKHLSALQVELAAIRELALQPGAPWANVRVALAAEKRCQKLFDNFCKDSGMTDEFVQMMVTDLLREALREAGVDVK